MQIICSFFLVDKYFSDTITRIEGIDIEDINEELINLHKKTFSKQISALEPKGIHGYRSGREEHIIDPLVIFHLQEACKLKDYKLFKKYSSLVDSKIIKLRDLMEFDTSEAINIERVESVENIIKKIPKLSILLIMFFSFLQSSFSSYLNLILLLI